jgi:hypothetical protein
MSSLVLFSTLVNCLSFILNGKVDRVEVFDLACYIAFADMHFSSRTFLVIIWSEISLSLSIADQAVAKRWD